METVSDRLVASHQVTSASLLLKYPALTCKSLDNIGRNQGMLARLYGGECATTGKGKGQQQLVREIRSRKRV